MSVNVIIHMQVERARLEQLFTDRADDLRAVHDQATAAGAIHHHFAASADGEVIIVDEWHDAESFAAFFDNPTIASMMAEAGVAGPPEVKVFEILDSPDRF